MFRWRWSEGNNFGVEKGKVTKNVMSIPVFNRFRKRKSNEFDRKTWMDMDTEMERERKII